MMGLSIIQKLTWTLFMGMRAIRAGATLMPKMCMSRAYVSRVLTAIVSTMVSGEQFVRFPPRAFVSTSVTTMGFVKKAFVRLVPSLSHH